MQLMQTRRDQRTSWESEFAHDSA